MDGRNGRSKRAGVHAYVCAIEALGAEVTRAEVTVFIWMTRVCVTAAHGGVRASVSCRSLPLCLLLFIRACVRACVRIVIR